MLSVLRHSFTPRIFLLASCEAAGLNVLLWALPFASRAYAHAALDGDRVTKLLFGGLALFATAAVQFSFWSFGLYSRESAYSGRDLTRRLGFALGFALVVLLPVYGVLRLSEHPLSEVSGVLCAVAFVSFGAGVAIERWILLKLLGTAPDFGRVLLLGAGDAAAEVLREAERCFGKHWTVAGVLAQRAAEIGRSVHKVEVTGTIAQVRDHVATTRADTILIAVDPRCAELPTDFLVRCQLSGIQVLAAADFYEAMTKKVLLELYSPLDLLGRRNLVMTRLRWQLKSLFEKTVALAILVPALPVMAVAALAVRLTSPGPVFYRQTRTGSNGRTFRLAKLRSMVDGAEKSSGAVWAQKNDSRVTRCGRILRATRIDELPQLFNILRGEMSIVGPRPERPEFVEQLSESIPHFDQRHLVKPGLTGWAQVAFRYGASIEDSAEKLRYDLYYIKHMSLGFDALIIINTVRIVLVKGGAR